MYRFGGLYREVPIAVRAELDESARIVSKAAARRAKAAILLAWSAHFVINS